MAVSISMHAIILVQRSLFDQVSCGVTQVALLLMALHFSYNWLVYANVEA